MPDAFAHVTDTKATEPRRLLNAFPCASRTPQHSHAHASCTCLVAPSSPATVTQNRCQYLSGRLRTRTCTRVQPLLPQTPTSRANAAPRTSQAPSMSSDDDVVHKASWCGAQLCTQAGYAAADARFGLEAAAVLAAACVVYALYAGAPLPAIPALLARLAYTSAASAAPTSATHSARCSTSCCTSQPETHEDCSVRRPSCTAVHRTSVLLERHCIRLRCRPLAVFEVHHMHAHSYVHTGRP